MPAMQETRVRPLGPEDALEKEVATYFSGWRIQELDRTERLSNKQQVHL